MAWTIPDTYAGQLSHLYAQMDQAYTLVARQTGFQCRGCGENCCRSLFFHHTWLEYLYLENGLRLLAPDRRKGIERRAAEVRDGTAKALAAGAQPRLMCPLNEDGRCLLYDYRPMICRLHGVAHRMRLPDGRMLKGPGCADFEERKAGREDGVLDRTPLYQAMAALEQALRLELGLNQKIKMTVAQMINDMKGAAMKVRL